MTDLFSYTPTDLIQRLTGEPAARVAELVAEFGGAAPLLAAEASRLRRAGLSSKAIDAIDTAHATARILLAGKLEGRDVLSSFNAVIDFLKADMGWARKESVRVLYLDSKNTLIANDVHQRGTVDQCSVWIREIIHRALDLGATALILAHNHPSGDPTPSRDDIKITNDLIAAARFLKLAVHDHIVIGANGHTSMRAQGCLDQGYLA